MDQNRLSKFLGLTRNELIIVLSLGGLLALVLMLFEGYVLYTARRAVAGTASAITPTPPLTAAVVVVPYVPAPSLTGWPTPTSATTQPTATKTRRPTSTPAPTNTPRPTRTPTATPVPTEPPPTPTIQFGTYDNPVPMGSAFALPGWGTLTVIKSSWLPGQTGLAVSDVSFLCERPIGQRCDTSKLILDALGGSGHGYERQFDPSIPEPSFGTLLRPDLYGGETDRGNAGFLIDSSESSLRMRVRIFLEDGEYYFWMATNPQGATSKVMP